MTKKQKKVLIRIVITAVLMIGLAFVPIKGSVRLCCYMVPYLIIGYDILRKAAKGIWNRQVFDENFLMAVATVGAIALGEYVEGVAVMLFYQIGELFQSYAVGKSRRNISELMDIRPDFANILREDGELEQVDPDEVEIGTTILVQPGEKVPIDGVILEGRTMFDSVALTGESIPKEAMEGDAVISGYINMTGAVKVRTTKEFGESTASRILEMVENASSKKSRSENFISRFARYYTPAVCYSALALAVLPPLVRMSLLQVSPDWGDWIFRALTFLVISCPCALVISIPLGFFAGIGGASREGILIKGSNYLEALSQVKKVVFDKTGTLTQGVFEVVDFYPAEGTGQEQLLEYAALAESYSTHPVGISIRRAYGEKIDKTRVTEVQEISGQGVGALVDGKKVSVTNQRYLQEQGISYEVPKQQGTIAYVTIDGQLAGSILIADRIKPNAAGMMKSLTRLAGIRPVILSGDRQGVVQAVAEQLGVQEYYGELLPGDKVTQVEAILKEMSGRGKVAFVGDGINDAPVLSRADVGIAMGMLGSDAAIEAADVVLMDDDLSKIVEAIRIARKCMRIVYENIYFAIGVKLLCLVLGAVGLANMWLAIFADVGVMVLAVLNAIRTLRIPKSFRTCVVESEAIPKETLEVVMEE